MDAFFATALRGAADDWFFEAPPFEVEVTHGRPSRASMNRSMKASAAGWHRPCRAQGQPVLGLVSTTLAAGLDKVHVDEGGVGAARHGATMSIAREHRAPERRRDGLLGAARACVGWGAHDYESSFELSWVALRMRAST